ncbi:Acetyltransferase (GNAT) family protein [Bifidobacterium commune]|uniref:Acetyltransferase (GNAT) family protein n=2 Tax=Bifidobacterium commune TaxID=1505727 RepID=A0A1C4GZP7_9BIFI|nr:Acetyltransferase (GNAT) family protein [Bifidobacterium commune]
MQNGARSGMTGEVIYAPMVWRDVENITRQFDQTWGHCTAVDDKELSMLLSYHSVLHYVEPATHGEVARKNGEFMGVILSRVAGQPLMFSNIAEQMMKVDEKINATEAGRRALADVELGFEIERRMERQTGINDNAPAEIELFLVSQASRGQGVGGDLWRRAMDYFVGLQVPMFYLHTDSDCDVSFYDRHGMKRIIEREERRHIDDGHDKPTTTSMFIYSGIPSQVKASGSAR